MEKILKIKFNGNANEYEIKEFLHELSCFACIDNVEIQKQNELLIKENTELRKKLNIYKHIVG